MVEILCIKNIDRYTLEFNGNTLLVKPKAKTRQISIDEAMVMSFTKSVVSFCEIRNTGVNTWANKTVSSGRVKYKHILVDLFASLPAQKLLQDTSFNMKLTDEHGKNGYWWCSQIHMSVQSKDATNTLREIVRLSIQNKYEVEMEVELQSGELVRLCIMK